MENKDANIRQVRQQIKNYFTMKYRYIVFILVLILCRLSLHAQMDMRGTDFWLTFGKNYDITYDANGELNLQIRIVGSELATTGNIYFTNLGTSVPFSIAAGEVYTYNLSDIEKQAAYNVTAGISNFSIHITSSAPITVYALNQCYRTTDATNILPVTALGIDYYHLSYTVVLPYYRDAYAIVITQNNTRIDTNGMLAATLNMGEVYYNTSSTDMTGTHITADKPVAFFAVHQGTQIPEDADFIDASFQQLAPVNTWGKTFFAPVSCRGRDFVRIIASQNGTNITQIGGTIQTVSGGQTALTNLNAGQWVELEISLANNGCYIQANKPVGVCTYLTAGTYNTDITDNSISDPSQAWLPSIEQKISAALISPFIPNVATNLKTHYALIITPMATQNNTTVKIGNGVEKRLSGGTWYDNSAAGMSFYSYPLTDDTSAYLFINRKGGLIIMGYGIGLAESYYYLSFSAMRSLNAAFYVNNVHYQDLAAEVICAQPLQFRANIEGDMSTAPEHLKWYINDIEEIAARDKLSWTKTLAPGTYPIKIEVLMDDNITTKTIESVLKIAIPPTVEATTTPEICGRENGTITLSVKSEEPSTVKYNWVDFFDTTSSLSNLKAGTYQATISDTFCLIEELITVKYTDGPVANFEPSAYSFINTQKITLTDMSQGTVQSWNWDMGDGNTQTGKAINYIYSDSGIYKVFLKVTDINNCTDTISKIIHVHGNLKIFIPNMFTPNGDGLNDTWKPVISNYLKEGYQLSIFDRLGQRVFHTTNTEEAWNGTVNGKPVAPNTVYSYNIIIQDIVGKEHKFSGSITVIR